MAHHNNEQSHGHNDVHGDHPESLHHITPLNVYFKVATALFVLTFLTVGFHALHEQMGALAPFIAFTIAAVKAFLVMAWFMHLKYEVFMNRIIFVTGFFFLMLLFAITALDIYSRSAVDSIL